MLRGTAVGLFAADLRLLLGGELVEAHGKPLGAAAVVHEDDRRAVLLDEREQLGIDRGPYRAAAGAVAVLGLGGGQAVFRHIRLAHVLDGHLDPHVERLADAGVDDRAVAAGSGQEAPDLLERSLRRREADPLDRPARLALEPLEAQREVGSALGLRHRVDLVDDHPLDALEDLPRARSEHQVERLGCRDQHVGRVAEHRLALALRGVAGADRHRDVAADALERGAQVALDVVGEGLQRGDVDEPGAARVVRDRLGDEAIEAPEEGGEGLPGARGGRQQNVLAARDRRPRLGLRRGRLREGAGKPVAYRLGERCERIRRHRTLQRNSSGCSAPGSRRTELRDPPSGSALTRPAAPG